MSSPGRIRAFDWLEGIAVLVMMQTHTVALLQPAARQRVSTCGSALDGLVAPSFILAAGFSLALVQVRGAGAGTRLRRALKSLRRIGEVLAVCTFMTWIWFPIFAEPKWLLRIDILNCIGLTLLLALPLFAWLATRPRLLCGLSLAAAVAILVATPVAAEVRALPWAHFLGQSSGSVFPLFPWSGYVFLGGSLGALAAISAPRQNRPLAGGARRGRRGALERLRRARDAAARRGVGHQPEPRRAHRDGEPRRAGAAGPRAPGDGRVAEERAGGGFVEVFGTSSLAAYFGHETMLFKRISGVSLETLCDHRAGWTAYWLLTALIIALTWGYTWIVAWLYDRVTLWPPRFERRAAAQPGGAAGPRQLEGRAGVPERSTRQ